MCVSSPQFLHPSVVDNGILGACGLEEAMENVSACWVLSCPALTTTVLVVSGTEAQNPRDDCNGRNSEKRHVAQYLVRMSKDQREKGTNLLWVSSKLNLVWEKPPCDQKRIIRSEHL